MSGEILIIEDNDKNLKLVRDLLQLHGYRTLEATTAAEGIALALEHLPACILLDIQLPDMEGQEALRHLRSDARTASIPVVAVTAFAMAEDGQRFLAAGFDGYLPKPIDVGRFPEQVASYCAPSPSSEQ